jgi:hypothetical protein
LPGNADEACVDFSQVVATYVPPFAPVIDSADNLTIERLTVRKFGKAYMTGGSLTMAGTSGRWRVGWRAGDDSYMEVTGGTITTAYTLEIAVNDAGSRGTAGASNRGELVFGNATASIGRGITLGDTTTSTHPTLGGPDIAILTMNSGTFTTSTLGTYGMLIQQGGTYNMKGGVMNLKDTLTINANATDTTIHGVINLSGGTIQGLTAFVLNGTGGANIDITGGKIIFTGDLRGVIQTAVDNGRITGNGILGGFEVGMPDPAGDLRWYYDGANTSLWAIPEPATLTLFGLGGLFLIRRKR